MKNILFSNSEEILPYGERLLLNDFQRMFRKIIKQWRHSNFCHKGGDFTTIKKSRCFTVFHKKKNSFCFIFDQQTPLLYYCLFICDIQENNY